MRQKTGTQSLSAEKVVKGTRRRSRKQHSGEEKIRIVLEGLRGEVKETLCAIVSFRLRTGPLHWPREGH